MTCREVHDALAAYADQQLPAGQRDAVAAHLCGCAACRRDLADIIEVRTLLGACAVEARDTCPSEALAGRLVAIAGEQAGHQVWLAPGGAARLPSPRRRRRNRALFAITAFAASAVCTVGSLALLAPGLPRVADPDATPSGAVPLALRQAGGAATTSPCPQGFDCPAELAGLAMTEAITDGRARVELVYGSPQAMVVVVQQRGQLAGPADAGVAAEAWQSGETVFCVMSADEHLAEVAAGALPHERAAGPSARERLAQGWHQLVGHRG